MDGFGYFMKITIYGKLLILWEKGYYIMGLKVIDTYIHSNQYIRYNTRWIYISKRHSHSI